MLPDVRQTLLLIREDGPAHPQNGAAWAMLRPKVLSCRSAGGAARSRAIASVDSSASASDRLHGVASTTLAVRPVPRAMRRRKPERR